MRAFILCGGLGTRLRGAVDDVPKVLAPIDGRPFLDLLIEQLRARGLSRFVLLAGYRADQVERHVAERWPALDLVVSTEPEPLGTGGAIKNAERHVDGAFVLVNGDTYCDVDIGTLVDAHRACDAAVTIAASHVADASRYGSLEIASDGLLRGFAEARRGPGLVNAGVYVVAPRVVAAIPAGRAVSFEHATLPALLARGERIHVVANHHGFVDIGTPESWREFSQRRRNG